MANCAVCKNLQPENFDLTQSLVSVRELKIPRRTLATSAAAGCWTCSIIYEARKATANDLGFHTKYICVREYIVGAPLRVSGLNLDSGYKDWWEVYTLEGYALFGFRNLAISDAK
jgi:hypothetical protein